MQTANIGPQGPCNKIISGSTLSATCSPGQVFVVPTGGSAGMYVCFTTNTWTLLDSSVSGEVTGSGTTNTIPKWSNGPGSIIADSLLTDDGTVLIYTGVGGIKSPFFVSAAANPADAGAVRLGNTELIAWEAATPGTDLTLGVNSSDVLASSAGFSAPSVTASGNVIGANIAPGFATTATAAGTTTLTVSSKGIQEFTGSTTQTVTLPVVSTLPQTGFGYFFTNNSSGAVTINSSGANTVQVMAAGTRAWISARLLTGTDATSWNVDYNGNGTLSGTVTANTLAKGISPGVVGDSQITDDGMDILIRPLAANASIKLAPGDPSVIIIGDSRAILSMGGFGTAVSAIGDVNIVGNGVRTIWDDSSKAITATAGGSESITIDGVAHTITNTAATSFVLATPLVNFSDAAYQGCTALSTNGSGDLICTASDARLKNIEGPLLYGLSEVLKLHPVIFTWKDGRYEGQRGGLIAQDVAEAMPLAVSTFGAERPDGKLLQLEKDAIIGSLVTAIQQLNSKVDALGAEIKELKARKP